MFAWKRIHIQVSPLLEEFLATCFDQGGRGHVSGTLRGFAERAHEAERHELLEEINRLMEEHGEAATIKRGDVLGS